eukprot:COSAG02_NODE_10104_length_2022_cov_3.576143_1_plen_76_part_10
MLAVRVLALRVLRADGKEKVQVTLAAGAPSQAVVCRFLPAQSFFFARRELPHALASLSAETRSSCPFLTTRQRGDI